ncbi:hypothetical protein P3W53_13350, partial [Pseudomonas denitrificans (nom. rej.)]|nr:hypothetical protein [Pseudomonas denitrificans (nom. rej.)]
MSIEHIQELETSRIVDETPSPVDISAKIRDQWVMGAQKLPFPEEIQGPEMKEPATRAGSFNKRIGLRRPFPAPVQLRT